jgi:hypothetical protein
MRLSSKSVVLALAAASALSAPSPGLARTLATPPPRQPAKHLRVIGSVATHGTQPFNSTPVAQRVFPREAYRDQGQPDLTSVLDQTPGALVSRPPDENFAVPNIPLYPLVRGGLPYETPISIDGAPLGLPSTGTLDLALIPTYVLQEVEVVKGPGDPAGMGGGVDGAINLRTVDPTLATRGTLELEGDSRGGQFSDLAYDGTLPGGKFAFASMFSVDGSPGPLAGLSLPGSPASDVLRKAMLLKLRFTPSDALTLSVTALTVNLDRALDGAYGALLGSDFVSLSPVLGARQDERLRFEQLLGQYGRGDDEFEMRLYGFDVSDDGYSGNVSLSNALDRERGAGVTWNHQSGPNLYALSLDASAADAYDADHSSLAAFGESLPRGSEDATARARATATLHPSSRTEIDLAAATDGSGAQIGSGAFRNWSAFDARLGASQLLTPTLSLRASLGTSSVAPPLDVLAVSFAPQYSIGLAPENVFFSSTVTQPERAQGADLGLEWRLHGGTTTLSFDLYETGTRDAFILSTTQPVPGLVEALWSNGPPMRDEGAEISLVQFKPVGLGFIVQAALPRTYVSGPMPANVAGIPYAQGYGEISYKWPRGSRASIGLLYAGANNAYGRPAFTEFNSNLELSVGAKSKLQVSVENLFDSLDGRLPIALIASTNANVLGPRTIRVMFRQSFGGGAIYER